MNGKKTTLPSLRNLEWKTAKTETEKINQELTCISTNNVTELNEIIYAKAKLICEKIGVPSKSTKTKIKTWMGNSNGNADKNLRKQAKGKTLEYIGKKRKSNTRKNNYTT